MDIERNNRRTRWFHAGVYLSVLPLLGTGWWLFAGQEGRPSVLATATGVADAQLHTYLGWAFAGVAGLGVLVGWRAAVTLIRDSVRFRRSEFRWLVRWPRAVFNGRFARHEGHFDPGQRVLNAIVITLLLALIVSGIGLVLVSGGPAFVWYNRVHRWSTYLFTPVIAGHVLIAAGILPGYRGIWRAMHVGGHLRRADAARVWPGWLERTSEDAGEQAEEDDAAGQQDRSGRGRRRP